MKKFTQKVAANDNYHVPHVLVVDDDTFLLELMVEILNDLGVSVVKVARTGLEGLQVYRQCEVPPDLIICDLCMPHLGGIEFLNHLAQQGCAANIIIMSGHNLIPPTSGHWNLSKYSGSVLNLAEKLARLQGLKVRATYEKPITKAKISTMLELIREVNTPTTC